MRKTDKQTPPTRATLKCVAGSALDAAPTAESATRPMTPLEQEKAEIYAAWGDLAPENREILRRVILETAAEDRATSTKSLRLVISNGNPKANAQESGRPS